MINPDKFQDIKIVDLEPNLTEPSRRGAAMRRMHLKLSDSPPREWVQLFDNERAFPRHSMWREAEISVNHIVVDCVPDEIAQYHLKDLKEDVSNVNAKYRDFLQKVLQEELQEKAKEDAERKRLNDLRGRLDFN